jgi:hypothetical protein
LVQSNDGLCSYVFIDDVRKLVGMELVIATDNKEELKGPEK